MNAFLRIITLRPVRKNIERERKSMIQDIYPARFDNHFEYRNPEKDSRVCCFQNGELLAFCDEEKHELVFPKYGEFPEEPEAVYLFSVDKDAYFLVKDTDAVPEGYTFYSLHAIRDLRMTTNVSGFIAYSAFHLWKWYMTSRFCGACGAKTEHDKVERAMVCPVCKNRIYPRINPAVIIGVTNGDRILITRYNRGFAHNALVAGFTEFGETLEETVQREVMEEAGIKVKNIRYYKSQPWGVALDLLAGFYCEVDGDDTISMDQSELKYAEWVRREDIVLQPSDYSLTNEMMKKFKDGEIR